MIFNGIMWINLIILGGVNVGINFNSFSELSISFING